MPSMKTKGGPNRGLRRDLKNTPRKKKKMGGAKNGSSRRDDALMKTGIQKGKGRCCRFQKGESPRLPLHSKKGKKNL